MKHQSSAHFMIRWRTYIRKLSTGIGYEVSSRRVCGNATLDTVVCVCVCASCCIGHARVAIESNTNPLPRFQIDQIQDSRTLWCKVFQCKIPIHLPPCQGVVSHIGWRKWTTISSRVRIPIGWNFNFFRRHLGKSHLCTTHSSRLRQYPKHDLWHRPMDASDSSVRCAHGRSIYRVVNKDAVWLVTPQFVYHHGADWSNAVNVTGCCCFCWQSIKWWVVCGWIRIYQRIAYYRAIFCAVYRAT